MAIDFLMKIMHGIGRRLTRYRQKYAKLVFYYKKMKISWETFLQ